MAEILITLGIIGVVAAVTMPTLIQHHKQVAAVTSLKKSYSLFQQAIKLSEAENSSFEYIEPPAVDHDPDALEEWWDKYLDKYFVDTKKYKQNNWFIIAFNNGSGVGIKSTNPNKIYMMVTHCINLNKCLNNEFQFNAADGAITDGKNSFWFLFDGKKYLPIGADQNLSREELKTGKNQSCDSEHPVYAHRYCAALLMYDGWQVKKDYPVRF